MAKMSLVVTQWIVADPARFSYRALLAVEIKDNNNQPLGGRAIVSAPEGEQIDIAVPAGRGIGNGELFFISRADGVVLMAEANVQGQMLTARTQIALKSKSVQRIPDRISVNTAGADGKYFFFVSVLDKDNAPVSDVPVRIINNNTGAEEDAGQTDQHGSFTSQEIAFAQSKCSFLVIAGGLDPVELKLDGPSRWRKAPIVPDPDPADVSQGTWHTISSAWCRATNDIRGIPPIPSPLPPPPSSPSRFQQALWRYTYRFRSDNDCRANTFMLLVAAFGLFWLIFFGITPATPGMDAEDIAFYNAAGENTPLFSDLGFSEWLKWAGWKFWWFCFGVAIIYRLVAWRDEVHRAWQAARQHAAEIRRAVHDLTPGGTTEAAAARTEHPLGLGPWLRVFIREFIAAISGDWLVGRR